ncbi:hypothetical protein R3P38DRAFT_3204514 [Favolaschia claudopus]|uniref:Uncharacterized protein n=1 Tax=Favolaschia claudopus TaxID=2862362 RepID=A0AAW0APN7_9AGAR
MLWMHQRQLSRTLRNRLIGTKRALPENDRSTTRTPKQADKRFLAHDILRALGKTPADDVQVQHTKLRAIMETENEQPPPLVLQRVSSNEPSAQSTPASSSLEPSSAGESIVPSLVTDLAMFLPPLPPPDVDVKRLLDLLGHEATVDQSRNSESQEWR